MMIPSQKPSEGNLKKNSINELRGKFQLVVLDDCFPQLYIQQDLPKEWIQTLVDAYRDDIKRLVRWFLEENLCEECKKKIGLI